MEITKEVAIKILNSRVLIPHAGRYTTKVTSVNSIIRESGQQVTIVNFACASPYNVSVSKKAFKAGDFEGAINKGTSMSASLLSGMYIPNKGEIVDIEVGDFVNKEGVNTLVVNAVMQRQAIKASNINVSNWEEEESDEFADIEQEIEGAVEAEATAKAGKAKVTA